MNIFMLTECVKTSSSISIKDFLYGFSTNTIAFSLRNDLLTGFMCCEIDLYSIRLHSKNELLSWTLLYCFFLIFHKNISLFAGYLLSLFTCVDLTPNIYLFVELTLEFMLYKQQVPRSTTYAKFKLSALVLLLDIFNNNSENNSYRHYHSMKILRIRTQI